ncbi:DUF427 domain-containing protein [Microbacterium sp. NPDC076895]|uniref:DUF427 domain-containing protein n=1 Tax=Microbacterium sp. NPDC076895 TaxID=3154957 RepID=UPI003428F982
MRPPRPEPVGAGQESVWDYPRPPRLEHVDAFAPGSLRSGEGTSLCEFKGQAAYLDVAANGRIAPRVGWTYPHPSRGFEQLTGRLALYPGPMDRCTVDGEIVTPQPGNFYGGWITSDIRGPFKGVPGSGGW